MNRSDIVLRLSRAALNSVIRLADLELCERKRRVFDVIETSAVTGSGLDVFLDWLVPGAGKTISIM